MRFEKRFFGFFGLAIVLLFSGCGVLTHGTKKVSPSQADFFVCNYWVDSNQDGKMDNGEWDSVKSDFRTNEHISFVGYFRQKTGTRIAFVLKAPDGSVYKEATLRQTGKTMIWHQEFEGKDMADKAGTGVWEIRWFVESNLVNITGIRLIEQQ